MSKAPHSALMQGSPRYRGFALIEHAGLLVTQLSVKDLELRRAPQFVINDCARVKV